MTAPKVPAGLSRTAGGRLWRALTSDYDLRPDELVVLEQACRTLADVEKITTALDGQSLVTAGSKGQARAHPLLPELLKARALVAALLKQLALPDDPAKAADAATDRQWKARRAARARWG